MDGNGRWARQRGLPRYAGHPAGVESVRKVVEHCVQQGIEVLTLFAFSSENWQRPKKEVGLIMDLFIRALRKEARRLHRNGVRLRVIGDRTAFPEKLQRRIHEVEALTAANSGLILQVAANYGGRWDIIRAARRLARQAAAGEIDVDAIDEQALAAQLAFPDLPDPDLFIRTGGECRVSNFLLWQAAYSELYFTDLLWPEFDAAALDAAIADYSRRQRRFGRTGEQVVETQSAKDL
ncbi:polyprenyl diphosphate synthase [Candidatus Endoriftia persephone]|jgi:undecaprenyl diphosphate synthase|uniref:Ditrans,polycis-undecaprenyl-diphosphate synthase ((2E,6E)-farnesyl-diphosphate specific) n=3 Tax=Gammaproteobacteria TaxID=1236 RepID=G2FI70_9GAMM|nr:polyprenyl diphosphate synthase [Candidatus Endoriftia persephone]EGW53497.1 undecaprenyl pyrophosphate synthase [endosymbiont of Tevnia jerichonana (vent Tica)]